MALELFDATMSNLEKSAKIQIEKQTVTNQNIANAGNPNYTAKKFDEVLGKAVERQENKQVVLEQEMADMAKTTSRYSATLKLLAAKYGVMRTVISQGRK